MNYNYKGPEPVQVKVVVFHNMGNMVFTVQQWKETGSYKGFLKENRFSINDIQKVITGTMSPVDFANMGEWNG